MESSPRPSSPTAQVPHIPTHSAASTTLRCCCGRDDCAFLQHNNVALEGLEKDLATAARLGQALLHRHESYMAEAEEDRHHRLASIESLEREKRQVQAENARIIEENRGLLVQLDELNRAVADSDERAKMLTTSLESTEAELRKVTASAARAADLEAQLVRMESEQSRLQDSLQSAQEHSRSAVQRWKQAESTLRNLHDQVDQIEKEAREERDRHADLVQRLERRRAVERELDGAAGRLKGAAAAQELSRNQGGTVVSRFVRDILQDNANLQIGIMELREMLESSNQEVQSLREQILSHQPLASVDQGDEGSDRQPGTTLCQELESHESRRVSQEFHIHHHYHTPPVPVGSKKEKATLLRRAKKRRSLGGSSNLHSASGSLSSRKSRHRAQSSTSSTSTILSQTSVSIPPTPRHWSLQSPGGDSIASSPQSAYRSSSIFDRVERGFESSRATSPESTVFLSPLRANKLKSPAYDGGFQSLEAQLSSDAADAPGDGDNDEFVDYHEYDEFEDRTVQSVIPEEGEDSSLHYAVSERGLSACPNDADDVFAPPYRSMMRKTSHESLFSVAGMDILTTSHHPSRMSDLSSPFPVRIPRHIMSSDSERFSLPVIETTTVTANRQPSKLNQSPRSLLASVAASSVPDSQSIDSDHSDSTVTASKTASIGRRVGGWVRGRWGTAPTFPNNNSNNNEVRPPTRESASSASSGSSKPIVSTTKATSTPPSVQSLRFRYPGVNQSGPIMGFRPPPRAPARVHAENVDEGLLRESLAE